MSALVVAKMRALWLEAATAFFLISVQPAIAEDTSSRFLEFDNDIASWTYDLETVKMLLPGRFTIVHTMIDNHDLMNLRLKTIEALQTYCGRKDGQYEAPLDILTATPPDMRIKAVSVRGGEADKHVFWFYPYKKF